MEIQINYHYRENDVASLFDIERLAKLILMGEHVPSESEVALTFVDEATIHELNKNYRNVDKPTDVLSFECDGVDDGFNTSEMYDSLVPYEIGDIIISVDRAESQASEYGLSFAEELSLLITHGLLHLCGYDHLEEDQANEMESREVQYLSEFWGRPFKRSVADGQ